MSTRHVRVTFAMLIVGSLLPAAWTQERPAASESAVDSSGQASLKRTPELFRMRLDLQAKGRNLAEALQKLKAKRTAATAKLVELGVAEKTLKFGDPKITGGENEQQAMQRMVRQRMAAMQAASQPAEKGESKPVIVSVSVTAEWPLNGGDAETLLLAAHEIEDKVTAADLAGSKEQEKLSPEEEEELEELQSQPRGWDGGAPQSLREARLQLCGEGHTSRTREAARGRFSEGAHARSGPGASRGRGTRGTAAPKRFGRRRSGGG